MPEFVPKLNNFYLTEQFFMIIIFLFLFFLQVEAGDVILKINGTDVHRFSTKEGELFTFDKLNVT